MAGAGNRVVTRVHTGVSGSQWAGSGRGHPGALAEEEPQPDGGGGRGRGTRERREGNPSESAQRTDPTTWMNGLKTSPAGNQVNFKDPQSIQGVKSNTKLFL